MRSFQRLSLSHLYLALATACGGCVYDFSRDWASPPPDLTVDRQPVWPDSSQPQPDLPPAPIDSTMDHQTAPPPDTLPTTPPTICWAGAAGASTVACPAGHVAIAGGVECAKGGVAASLAQPDGTAWRTGCAAAAPVFTEAICATGSWSRARQVGQGKATALCGPGTAVVGGGCQCTGGGLLIAHQPAIAGEGWTCACTAGGVAVEAVCGTTALVTALGRQTRADTRAANGKVGVHCPATTDVLSGGCQGDTALAITAGLGDPQGWFCAFVTAASQATARAICIANGYPNCS